MNKDFLLNDSKVFCMFPWVHVHTPPDGKIAPCCIGKSCYDNQLYRSDNKSLLEVVNSDNLKQLRLDMIRGIPNSECNTCYNHDEHKIVSFRKTNNREYGKYIEEALNCTEEDGSLSEFKMRYFDIRFNNICNFKCRTCSQEYSSKWEHENKVNNVSYYKPSPKNNNKRLLSDTINQLDYIETAYFAGGEPLITEEHYILLEEMIRSGNTDIQLRYNTNFSTLNFKNKDILSLWSNFKKTIEVYASIDHYGERAEYIRTGTDWATLQQNFKEAQKIPFVTMRINTVLSIFNFLTMDKIYQYFIENEMFNSKTDNKFFVYFLDGPRHLSCQILPKIFKQKGKESVMGAIDFMKSHNIPIENIYKLTPISDWVDSHENEWDTLKFIFKEEIIRLDNIRQTSFTDTFPELADLMDS